jgi:hypothetical protein
MRVRRVLLLAIVCLGLFVGFLGTLKLIYPPVTTFQGHTGPVWYVVASPDGKLMALAMNDKTVKMWQVTSVPGVPR